MRLEIIDSLLAQQVHVQLKARGRVKKHGSGRGPQPAEQVLVHLHHGGGQLAGAHEHHVGEPLIVAAVLAVIGYSLNDTVVAFDRIRENFFALRGVSAEEAINTSINEMLARTIITGLTTLLVLIALLTLGGESIAPFSIALIVGIVVGTYSSIYVASATALLLGVNAQDLIEPVKDPELIDDLP